MVEAVHRLVAPVGAGRLDQLLAPHRFEQRRQRRVRTRELAQRAEAELRADDRRELEQRRARRAGAARRARASSDWIVGGTSTASASIVSSHSSPSAADDLVVHEHAHELAHEQRVAVGGRRAAVRRARRAAGRCRAVRPRAPRWRRSRARRARARRRRGGSRSASDGRTSRSSGRARHNKRSGHVVHPLGEVLEQVEQQRLGPLDVVDHHDQRPARRGGAHQPADGPERLLHRAGRRRADEPAEDVDEAVAVGVVVGEQRRRGARGPTPASASSPSPVASRISCAIGANVASPARSQRISKVIASSSAAVAAHSSRDRRVLPTPGEPSTVTSRAARVRDGGVEHGAEPFHLRVAADERRRGLGRGRRVRRRPRRSRPAAARPATRHLAERLVPELAAREPPRLLADGTWPGGTRARCRAATLSASPTRSASPLAITTSPVLTPTRRPSVSPCCAATSAAKSWNRCWISMPARTARIGVVLGDLGDAERGHHPVAHELGDGAAVRVDRSWSSAWYRARTGRATSASVRSPKPVEPPRSAKSTVTVLRTRAASEPRAADVAVADAPHSSQNFSFGSSSASQFEQRRARGDPHSPQKRAPSRFVSPHCAQSKAPRLRLCR